MSELISKGEYYQATGRINTPIYIVIPTSGITSFSVIFESFDLDNNPVNFPINSKYSIHVSNNAGYLKAEVPYDYYNIMLVENDPRWIHLRDISLPDNDV